jgi:hypothetical protein
MVRRLIGTATGGGVLGTVLTAGWVGGMVLIGVVVVLVGAVCWVLADPDRSARVALLVTAWRTRPEIRHPVRQRGRRTAQRR